MVSWTGVDSESEKTDLPLSALRYRCIYDRQGAYEPSHMNSHI